VFQRIHRIHRATLDSIKKANSLTPEDIFRLAVCPHDDYTYAGFLYESVLPFIKAKTVILFGVAHKARKFDVERKLVFDSFDVWKEPDGNVRVSALREEIMRNLPPEDFIVHDSLQQAEHSVEALIPFLQYHNRNVQIVSILVPAMDFDLMKKISGDLAGAINKVMNKNRLDWGKDLALVISTDAVHYGDEEWGGSNYAQYGCDEAGYEKAVQHEKEIISNCLLPELSTATIQKFFDYTVQPGNWREYQWTWCGRYSVPMGLLTGMNLSEIRKEKTPEGLEMGYSTSIAQKPLPVEDLNMGKTANATLHHWVGYAAVGYK
jgi:AmmeMemoRadiSam system protein B